MISKQTLNEWASLLAQANAPQQCPSDPGPSQARYFLERGIVAKLNAVVTTLIFHEDLMERITRAAMRLPPDPVVIDPDKASGIDLAAIKDDQS